MVKNVLLLKLCIVWTLTAPRGTSYCNIYLLLVYSFHPAMYIQPQANPPRFSKNYVVCIYVCTYVCMYVHIYVCMYIYMYVCIYVCMHVYVWMYACMHSGMYRCMHVCIYMYVRMYVSMYVCMCVRIYVYMSHCHIHLKNCLPSLMNNISIYVHDYRKLYLGNCPFHIRTLNQHTVSNMM